MVYVHFSLFLYIGTPKMNMKKTIAILAVGTVLCGCTAGKPEPGLQPAGFDTVTVGGELAARIDRNFDRLETEMYYPENVYWTEEESGGWPADKEGRTMLGLILDSRASGRTPLYLQQMIDMLPEHLNGKGYMGTIHENVNEQQLSGHGWLLRALCEWYEWKNDPKALEIARGIAENLFLPVQPYIAQYPLTTEERITGEGDMSGHTANTVNGWQLSTDIGCVFIGMEGLIHYYKHDRNPEIKVLIDEMVDLFLRMDLVDIKAQTHASLTALRGMIRYADITGDNSLLPEIEKRWALYEKCGMTENFANFNWFERYDTWTEPCAIIDSYLLAVQLWMKTRNPHYLEMAEKIYFNGIGVAQRANGGFGCDKCVGPALDTLSINADEAWWCCTMRGGEGLGRAAEYAYFVEGADIYVPFYRENKLALDDFVMEQHTDYPFGNEVEFVVTEGAAREMELKLSAPAYMKNIGLTLNGEDVEAEAAEGFITLKRRFRAGDVVVLTYGFENETVPAVTAAGKSKVMYGPLVLGQDDRTPLYHLMDPAVSKEAGYCRPVLK